MNRFTPIPALVLILGLTPAFAQTVGPVNTVIVGSTATQSVDTNLDGHPVPADIGQIYIGNTVQSADAITIDSGSNFPPGIAFRRYLGTPSAPRVITPGTQLGYIDFRGYSGTQFWNAGSLDMVVDGLSPFNNGSLPTSKMRFAVSNGGDVFFPMELRSNGMLEIGALDGTRYSGPATLGSPKLFVNTNENEWGVIIAARAAQGPSYALRTHTTGETAADYLFAGSSGAGSGSVKFSVQGNGDVHVSGRLFVGADQIIGQPAAISANLAGIAAMFGSAAGPNSLALGAGSRSTSANSTAIGNDTTATGSNALSIGNGARANGTSAISLGDATVASGEGAIALGSRSVSTTQSAVAVGEAANAIRKNGLALGAGSLAEGEAATVAGYQASAVASNATAIGANSRALHQGSTAIGAGAKTTAENEVALGGAGTSVRIGDLEASTAAQVGPVEVVTVDDSGTLGRQSVVTTVQFNAVSASMIGALAISDTQFDELSGRVDGIAGQVDELFDVAASQQKETRQGIATVTALAQPHFPSEIGKTSYASNIGYYRGQVGVSAGLMHRFDRDFAVSASISYGGGKNTALRAGVAGEF